MSYSPNSLKGGYIGDYFIKGETRSLVSYGVYLGLGGPKGDYIGFRGLGFRV